MRGIILFSALALVHGGVIKYNSNGCPEDYTIQKLLPHEDCTQFYQCLNGIKIPRLCASGLYFDATREKCNWPKISKCQSKEQDDATADKETEQEYNTSDPSQAPEICASPNSNDILVAHENCNQFYKCSFGTPVALRCPVNLLYHPGQEECEWPENVDCGNRIIPADDDEENYNGNGENEDTVTEIIKDINDDPNQAPAICKAEGSDGLLVAHENCNKFYKCSFGKPVAMNCQLNLLYNPNIEQCDWPDNVNCGDRIIPEDDNNEGENDGYGDGESENEGTDDVTDINDDPSAAPEICKAEGSEGVLVAHEYCTKFYKCSHGRPVALKCEPDLLYNPSKEYCDWATNVNCGDRIIPEERNDADDDDDENAESDDEGVESTEEINDDPSAAPVICKGESSEGVLVAHEHCNKFYKCAHGHPYPMKCQLNLLYHPAKKYCDWPTNVDCGYRILPEIESKHI